MNDLNLCDSIFNIIKKLLVSFNAMHYHDNMLMRYI